MLLYIRRKCYNVSCIFRYFVFLGKKEGSPINVMIARLPLIHLQTLTSTGDLNMSGPAVCLFSLPFFNQEMLPNPFVSLIFLWLPISSISNQKTPIGPFGWTEPSIDFIEFSLAEMRREKTRSILFIFIFFNSESPFALLRDEWIELLKKILANSELCFSSGRREWQQVWVSPHIYDPIYTTDRILDSLFFCLSSYKKEDI